MIYKANSLVIQINKISFRNMGFVFLPTLKQEFTEVPCCIACYAQVGKKSVIILMALSLLFLFQVPPINTLLLLN